MVVLPNWSYGGKKEIMEKVAPTVQAYQAGTMAGNPASMLSGIACLEVLKQEGVYEHLDQLGALLEEGILQAANKFDRHMSITINRLKGALTVYFTNEKIENYDQAQNTDGEMFGKFFKLMLEQGVNLAPSKYEAWFITIAHTKEDIQATIQAVEKAFSGFIRKITYSFFTHLGEQILLPFFRFK